MRQFLSMYRFYDIFSRWNLHLDKHYIPGSLTNQVVVCDTILQYILYYLSRICNNFSDWGGHEAMSNAIPQCSPSLHLHYSLSAQGGKSIWPHWKHIPNKLQETFKAKERLPSKCSSTTVHTLPSVYRFNVKTPNNASQLIRVRENKALQAKLEVLLCHTVSYVSFMSSCKSSSLISLFTMSCITSACHHISQLPSGSFMPPSQPLSLL